jgi:hypothetical protein
MYRLARFVGKTPFLALAILLVAAPSLRAQHHAMVEWYADLTEPETSVTPSRDIGRVTATVDFPHQTVTFHTMIKDPSGLRRVEVRSASGAIFTIFDAHEGRFTGESTRTAEGAAFSNVATPILNSQAAVAITTDTHPDGEVVGQIVMHKHYE